MPLEIREFPDNPPDRKFCFVWTRKVDGKEVIFGCDTEENCRKAFPRYRDRSRMADDANSENM